MSGESSDSGQYRSVTSFFVKIGETTLRQQEGGGVESIVVEDHLDMVDAATIRLEGRRDATFNIGDEVEVKAEEQGATLFKGQVTALEPVFQRDGGYSLAVRALDAMHKLGRGRKTRFWEDITDSDIVSEVGAECGLSVEMDATSETMPYVLQRNETNVAFLKRLAARNNYMLRVEDDKLTFKESQYASGSNFTLAYGKDITNLRISFNSVDQVSEVIVRGWDIMNKEEVVGVASSGDVTKIGGGELGITTAEGAFDMSTTAYITDVPVSSQTQATAIAKAELERIARGFARGTATLRGNDEIKAGVKITVSGCSSPMDGTYYVLATRHVLSTQSGYLTEITFCSNSYGS